MKSSKIKNEQFRPSTILGNTMARNFNKMKKGIMFFLLFEIITIFIACSGSLKDPLKASELSGSPLDNFLNSSFDYGPAEHTDTIKEVFYSGNQDEGYQISNPKNIGKQGGDAYTALVITKNDTPIDKYNTIIYFKDYKGWYLDYIKQNINGKTNKYDYADDKNAVLLAIFPSNFFKTIASDIEIQEQKNVEAKVVEEKKAAEEYAKNHTPEGWPIDSIYTSELILREGVLDMHGYTIGQLFYTGNRAEGVTVAKPKVNGQFQIIAITIKNVETDYTSIINLYLKYDSKTKLALLERIENIGGDGTKTISEEFREKYMVLTMILPYLLNEGNLGETY